MEACELTVKEVVQYLGNPNLKSICQTVIDYLDLEDLEALNK